MGKIFTVTSPLEYTVSCSQYRWENHIITHHPIMKNKEHVVANAVSNPVAIYPSNEFDNTDVYFAHSGNTNDKFKYTKVIVATNPENDSEVISAWFQPDISGNIVPEVIKYVKTKL